MLDHMKVCSCSEWLDPYNNYIEDLQHPEVYDDVWRKFNLFHTCKDFLGSIGVKLTWPVRFQGKQLWTVAQGLAIASTS